MVGKNPPPNSFFGPLLRLLISLPVEFPADIFVVHEALNINGKICGVGRHLLLQLFYLSTQAQEGPGIVGGVNPGQQPGDLYGAQVALPHKGYGTG